MTNNSKYHPNSIVETKNIGKGTRVWAFAHILPNAVVGEDCNICDHTFIENDVIIGDRVTVKCGVQLWDGLRIENDVFIGPNVTFTNDLFPKSKIKPESFLITKVRQGASIGANSTILPGITIGRYAMIGAGAVVTNNVPPFAKVAGNPAQIIGYTSSQIADKSQSSNRLTPEDSSSITVKGVKFFRNKVIEDLRGNLITQEIEKDLPFLPKRYFLIFDVPNREISGEHAHRKLEQLLICIHGSVSCVLDDGTNRQEFVLDSPNLGLLIPPMVWGTQYKYSKEAKLLVLASDIYDTQDYIRDYDTFLSEVKS